MLPDLSSILWLSVLLQVIAAVLALRLIPITGRATAWVVLSIGFMLMASRRAISLLHQQGVIQGEWLAAMSSEVVALVISILIVAGVILLRNVFVKKRHDEDELLKLSQVVEENSSSTIITDLEGKIEYVNHQFTEVTGYTLNEVKGHSTKFLNSGKTRSDAFLEMWKSITSGNVWVGEFCNRCKNGDLRWEKVRVSPVKDNEGLTTHYVAVLEDITEQKAQREALEFMAMHDSLTDLPNRSLFYDRVFQSILNAEHEQKSIAVMLMDLNHFKVINDTLGHHVGDMILKKIAARLQMGVKSYDTVARMGGDEFLVLLTDVDEKLAMSIANRLLDIVRRPLSVEGHNFDIGMSIGVALYPRDGDDPDQLIQRADVAMYSAKALSSGIAMYEPGLDNNSVGRLDLLGEIRQSLEEGHFCLHYQPRVGMADLSVEGVEALVRWQHPQQGLICPDDFIPLLEETGHITRLTRWIFRHAIEQLSVWQISKPDMVMSINVSTRDLCDQNLASDLGKVLEEFSVSSDNVILEITESALMQYSHYTRSTLNELEQLGIKLAIDDFGTGYSSLTYLKEMPISELKIDKSFVINMMSDENDEVIVRSTIDLGHNLGLQVVAEGVEDEATCKALQGLNCKHAQGYYFSAPVEAEVITEMIETNQLISGVSA